MRPCSSSLVYYQDSVGQLKDIRLIDIRTYDFMGLLLVAPSHMLDF